jgi:hypothetical protein
MESTLLAVTAEVRVANPDFVINLGDMLDDHLFGSANGDDDVFTWVMRCS